jgi:hypothetical protein
MFSVAALSRPSRPPVEKALSHRLEIGMISGEVRQAPQGGSMGLDVASMGRRSVKKMAVGREYMVDVID